MHKFRHALNFLEDWGRVRGKKDIGNPARVEPPPGTVSLSMQWTSVITLLINKRSCGNPLDLQESQGFDVVFLLRTCNNKSLVCIPVCPLRISGATWDALLRWKQDNMLVEAVFFFGFVFCRLFAHVKTFFIYCFLDSSLMESGQGISAEKRALHTTIWSQISLNSLSLFSLSFSLAVFHLTPLSPSTCPSNPSQSNLYLSLHRPISSSCVLFPLPPLPCSPALILVVPGPRLLCQCVWLKCSPWRNKICEENFIVSASSSSCADILCWWRRGFAFYFSFFSLLVISGSSHHVSLWVFLDQDMAVLAAELYKISAWFLVN